MVRSNNVRKNHSDLEEFQVPCLRNVGGGHGIYVGLCRPVQAPIYMWKLHGVFSCHIVWVDLVLETKN